MLAVRRLAFAALAVVAVAGCDPKSDIDAEVVDTSSNTTNAAGVETGAGGPALWKMGDEDTTVYLFGTVHVLPSELEWRTAEMDAAMDSATAVYFETDIDPDPVALTQIVTQLGLYPAGQKLSDRLSAQQQQTLAEASSELGVSMLMIDSMKPWLAAMTLSERMVEKAGYNPASGVERTLAPIALGANKEIRTFESIEDQLRIFADMSEEDQIDYLMDGLDDIDDESEILDELVAHWANGDVEALAQIMIREELAETPELMEALLVNRNRNWTQAIDTLVKTEAGVFFIAVGAAHLAGDDSVVRMLAAKGYDSTRVD